MNKLLISRAQTLLIRRCMCVPASGSDPAPDARSMSKRYSPTEFQKRLLVWTKKYERKEDIPKFVSAEVIDRSRSEARIKLSNILMVLTALASFGAIMAGKSAAKRGESVHKMNLDWHKQYNEEQDRKNVVNTK